MDTAQANGTCQKHCAHKKEENKNVKKHWENVSVREHTKNDGFMTTPKFHRKRNRANRCSFKAKTERRVEKSSLDFRKRENGSSFTIVRGEQKYRCAPSHRKHSSLVHAQTSQNITPESTSKKSILTGEKGPPKWDPAIFR